MPDSDWLAAAFEEQRDHLRGVAYRLLGSMADADDAVFAPAGRLQVVLILTVSAARKVTRIEVIADPDRLQGLRLALLPD